ncbi:hypothetical protein NDU88_006192 [Pleurodeles waltl]|uniref:Uncharacterized protein n=1 Tax=Pleurodeles waltl TaxID=8319 RepID=A0AAV7NSC9_PLEWA|nr:hypothetical protein NDU88_006192 [Pleurodeles waltl]
MSTVRAKKERSLKDMLIKVAKPSGNGKPPGQDTDHPGGMEDGEGPVTWIFLEAFFTSLHDDLQVVKRDLSANRHEVQCNLDEIGDRVAATEKRENTGE